MTTDPPRPALAAGAAGSSHAFTEVGPYVGGTSLAVGPGLVFVSGDGSWSRPAT